MSEPIVTDSTTIDSADARLRAARDYLATVPLMGDYVEQLAAHLGDSPARREQLRALLEPHRDQVEAAHIALIVKYLSATEIAALTHFQASREGRSIMKKMGGFQSELVGALTPVLRAVVEEALRAAPAR